MADGTGSGVGGEKFSSEILLGGPAEKRDGGPLPCGPVFGRGRRRGCGGRLVPMPRGRRAPAKVYDRDDDPHRRDGHQRKPSPSRCDQTPHTRQGMRRRVMAWGFCGLMGSASELRSRVTHVSLMSDTARSHEILR